MGGAVDAEGGTGHHGIPGVGQAGPELGGNPHPVCRARPGADHRHGGGADLGEVDRADDPQADRRGTERINPAGPFGVAGHDHAPALAARERHHLAEIDARHPGPQRFRCPGAVLDDGGQGIDGTQLFDERRGTTIPRLRDP